MTRRIFARVESCRRDGGARRWLGNARVLGLLSLFFFTFSSFNVYSDPPKDEEKLDPRDAAFIVVNAKHDQYTVTINDKAYPRSSKIGAAVAPNKVHEVVVTHNTSKSSKRYRLKLKKGESRVLIVDISGSSTTGAVASQAVPSQPAAATSDAQSEEPAEGAGPNEGFITVNAEPPGQVYIDGKIVSSRTPLVKHKVSAGNHSVRVYYVDLRKFSETKKAVVSEGRHLSMSFSGN
ncbi:MAG: PEGA domain-containing protein [Myxococcota bacterium]|jgi:hypothetical protein|nr:PEGA domain-containing protein [Myxococcota bacterium]